MRMAIVSSARLQEPIRGGPFTSLAASDHLGAIERAEAKMNAAELQMRKAVSRWQNAAKQYHEELRRAAQLQAEGKVVPIQTDTR